MVSEKIKKIEPSPTFALAARINEMKKRGIDVISFGIGEPDFDTPENIKTAATNAIKSNFTKYTPSSGIPELKEAVARKFKHDNGLDYKPSEILVSCGAKQCLYNMMQALLNPGDEVIIPVPYWVSYIEQVKLADGRPVLLETDRFKINPDTLREGITKKTRLLILNSPSNPTGAVYTKEELEEIANIVVEKNIFVISDEIYEKFIYPQMDASARTHKPIDDAKHRPAVLRQWNGVKRSSRHYSIASFSDDIKKLTITVNGVSKTYAMTGWRIGYCAASEEIIKAASNMQDQSTSNPCSVSQKAALEALNGPQDSVEIMRKEFEKRRNFIVKRLNEIPGVECSTPQGAFYVFPKVSKLYENGIKNSLAFSNTLLEKARIAVVPGSAFGADDYIRLSYATSMKNIEEGMDRLEEFCKNL
ncbi:MAG: pyridoxal phosphate-dependent aminotransferase [Candidatus Omnitrophica bacterium]|nr:pyridoxal phosphate-dependent aminotransferase [Candidatus Omnitrophota bacterium]